MGPLSMETRQGLSRVQDFLKSSLVRLQQPPPFGSLEWESGQRDDWLLVTQSTFVSLGFIRKNKTPGEEAEGSWTSRVGQEGPWP